MAEQRLMTLSMMKNGKTEEQKTVIDYFAGEKSGCMKKGIADEKFDEIVKNKLNEYASKSRALSMLGIDSDQVTEIAPIFFHGFSTSLQGNDAEAILNWKYAFKTGKDGRFRTSAYDATWLFFGDEEMFVYSVEIDLMSVEKTERTDEYFYKDITNFATNIKTVEQQMTTVQKGCFGKSSAQTETTAKEIKKFYLTVPGSDFYCSVSGVPTADAALQGLKQKLRDKKIG